MASLLLVAMPFAPSSVLLGGLLAGRVMCCDAGAKLALLLPRARATSNLGAAICMVRSL